MAAASSTPIGSWWVNLLGHGNPRSMPRWRRQLDFS